MSALRVGPASAELRASLRPIEWMVLEELALAAGADETGRLVAPTSARAVAEHLGLTAGAVARALARLRALGLVSHLRRCGHPGASGRRATCWAPGRRKRHLPHLLLRLLPLRRCGLFSMLPVNTHGLPRGHHDHEPREPESADPEKMRCGGRSALSPVISSQHVCRAQ